MSPYLIISLSRCKRVLTGCQLIKISNTKIQLNSLLKGIEKIDVNKNIYIFGIAMDEEEKKEVINEANKIYDVNEVIPSIYLATELSRNKL